MSWKDFAEKFTNGQQGASVGGTATGGWEAFQKKFEAMQNGQSGAAEASSGWENFRRKMTGEERSSSDLDAYKNSGMDALRKDAGALADEMSSYFYYSHSPNSANSSYRAKAQSMLSAIENEKKYFEYYADRFTKDDLANYMAELDGYAQQLQELDSYYGDGGKATTRNGALIGSGYAALSNRLSQLGKDMQGFTAEGKILQKNSSRQSATFPKTPRNSPMRKKRRSRKNLRITGIISGMYLPTFRITERD